MMSNEKRAWIYDVLLIVVLVLAAYLRVTGEDWGEFQNQHPDELFISGVVDNLRAHACMDAGVSIDACPPEQQRWMTPSEFFDTAHSTLNPNNRGAPFYVYGTLPLFLVRYTYEVLGPNFASVKLLGREFSALADLFSILVLYLIIARLYNKRVALLAALFSALAVMQIQQSHYFTVDLFMNPWMYLALYFAVRVAYDPPAIKSEDQMRTPFSFALLIRDPVFWNSIFFGLALGLGAASKINAAVLAVALPGALALRFGRKPSLDHLSDPASNLLNENWLPITLYLIAGALATLLAFRIFQPYAFVGLLPNLQWIGNLKEQYAQATGTADLPWNLQWTRRTHLYSFTNLTVWGLGLPLGILAWTGFCYMAWRILKGERRHILLWSWTALYFGWQSLQFNPTMRYQLPIYPLLCMMAAYFVFEVAGSKLKFERGEKLLTLNFKYIGIALGGIVLIATGVWAFAFLSVYTHPETRMAASRWIYQNVPTAVNLEIQTADGSVYNQPLSVPTGTMLGQDVPDSFGFTAQQSGTLSQVLFEHVLNLAATNSTLTLSINGQSSPAPNAPLAHAEVTSTFAAGADPRGQSVTLKLNRPLAVNQGQSYILNLQASGGNLVLAGSAFANETDFDWSLPFRIDGYDAFGGMYRGDLNLQVYWDDNADKLTRFETTLNQADYIFIPTNHQYAQITRVPERYPLTTLYYRELLGCPPDKNIIWCYRVAEPGMFKGNLGFDLVKTFESYPTLGPLVINDQAAEEAFTFYDHPKVLVFKKRSDYSTAQVQSVLGAVDLSRAVHLTPLEINQYQNKDLMLSPTSLVQQQAGGTWSQLFNYDWIQNRYPLLGLIIWYLFIFLLGLLTYPVVRLALPGLGDKGYPLARALGLILFGFMCWAGGSFGVPVTRLTVGVIFAFLAAAGLGFGWMQRDELLEEWKSKKKYFLMIEGLFLAFFLFDLFIRIGNPDLWHPAKGGERPMDFSYFNAVIKSTSFPPYDPWFAGGYINYYYYGFVLVGMPVKLLGIVPTIAYNFILPTLFAMVAMGAFCVAWNLVSGGRNSIFDTQKSNIEYRTLGASAGVSNFDYRFIAGLLAALLMVVLGNLGTIRMVYQGFEKMAAPSGNIDVATNIFQRMVWATEGLGKAVIGQSLPYGRGDWYWDPSRVIPPGPGNEITEFPFFTFLYSDLHAHMMVMPIALFVVAWTLSIVLARAHWRNKFSAALSFLIGGLAIGALYPTNLSDIYTYLPIALAALAYAIWNYADVIHARWLTSIPNVVKKLALMIGAFILLIVLTYGLYEPYHAAYSQGYNWVDPWTASHTPIWSYFAHWGVFLFFIIVWLAWETRQWLASTPVSSLNKLRPYQILIEAGIAIFVIALLYLAYRQVEIGWIALPLVAWAGILLLRPNLPDVKRVVLFWIGTALLITIMVELVAVRGDIGRMNTIFKFYLQAWLLLAVSSGAAFVWIVQELSQWKQGWRNFFQAGTSLFLAGAFAFTLTATFDKVSDRMANGVPFTLDSITYMKYAQYADFGVTMDLVYDYKAIRWMQDNVQGSPVIVEANCPEYRWCTRFTIYTGLPGVVGWNWHQRQQRTLTPELVEGRVSEVDSFYTTTDIQSALAFLKKYNVKYIIVGQLEHAEYPGLGLDKFESQNGRLWHSIYRDGNTVIYQVNP
jgi:YYY domain-containing protein